MSLDGYIYFDHSRQVANPRAPHNFGGVGCFVKVSYAKDYEISQDKSYDGVLALTFKHKRSCFRFMIINVYLPPCNSVYGRNATEFMSHILSLIYLYADFDAIYLVGDLNARIGSLSDYVPNVDTVQNRTVIDKVHNKHGEVLIDFLLESTMVIINGRINPENDNFTRVHTTGSSVVDYICTFPDNLEKCIYFKVNLITDLMHTCNLCNNKIPDHSVLEVHLLHNHVYYPDDNVFFVEPSITNCDTFDNTVDTYRYLNCNNGRKMPVNFLESETASAAVNECINAIGTADNTQIDVDSLYKQFCDVYYNEIDKVFSIKNRQSKKCYRNTPKPYWNDFFNELWKDMHNAQKRYLSCPQNSDTRRHALKVFKDKQSLFDKSYSKAKRKFQRDKLVNIERMKVENPKQFWAELRKLGPRKKDLIPIEVYDDNGRVINDPNFVLSKWKGEFRNLLKGYNKNEFDQIHFEYVQQRLLDLENRTGTNIELNEPLTLGEIKLALKKAKMNKAVGIDNLCYEIMKNDESNRLLLHLFNKILSCNKIPNLWRKTILKPIPKNMSIDPKIPTQYRGIALLSIVYKLFTSVINMRLVKFLENNDLLREEQNGFRKARSCADHAYVLNTIIRNRLLNNQPTYVAFLDAEKAFDRIDRTLLLYKLQTCGINGNIYEILKSIYAETTCCIKINEMLTDWFNTESGVLQGDTLSPTLFNIFVNDLILDVNSLDKGIYFGENRVTILLYADDIAVMSDSAENLQIILDKIFSWSRKNMIKFNEKKSNVVHFRKKFQEKTLFTFKLGDANINIVNEYKYLGLILNEFQDYNVTAKVLADAANRALGAIINKYLSNNGLGYYTYTRLFNSGVCPILDYCSEVWGFKNFSQIDNIQHKAIQIFLGVHRFAPIAAISGDMGWTQCQTRRHVCMIRMYNRIVNMNDHRLPRIVYEWDKTVNGNTWSSEVKSILSSCGLTACFNNNNPVNTHSVWASIHESNCSQWKHEIESKPKLRTYKLLKQSFGVESYVTAFINRKQRSCVSQLRCGILPLFIETGRWSNISYDQRICKMCSCNQVENEIHFLFQCSYYDETRKSFIENTLNEIPNFTDLDDVEKLRVCMHKQFVNSFCKYVYTIFHIRQCHMFIDVSN